MYTGAFWKSAFERAVKTAAQTLAAFLVADVALWDVDWEHGLGIAATATALSLLTSLGSAPFGPSGSPSLVNDPNAAHSDY
jgi:hypothetical protein